MQKRLVFLFLILWSLLGQAQSIWIAGGDSTKVRGEIVSHFEGNANRLSNTVQRKLLWGGTMESSLLQEVRDKLRTRGNRFGFEFDNEIAVAWKRPSHTWVFGYGYRELLGMDFSQDFYGILFLGNAAYEGKTADLSHTNFRYEQYNGLHAGIAKQIVQGRAGTVYVGLSALYGFKHQALEVNQASLYTAPDGAYLELSADNFRLQYTEPGFGLGAALRLGYHIANERHAFFFMAKDLGFIQWQEATLLKASAATQFKGIGVNDISSSQSLLDFSGEGLLGQFGAEQRTAKGLTIATPFALTARYERTWTPYWSTLLDAYYTKMPGYIPRLAVRMERKIVRGLEANAGLAYGGFGRENFLLGGTKQFAKHWHLSCDAYFVGMLVSKRTSHGFGLTVALGKSF